MVLEPKTIELVGSNNYEIGLKYGKSAREDITRGIELNYRITKYYTGLRREECIKNVRKYIPMLQKYVPHLYEEMRGIADGCELPFEDVLVHNFHARDLVAGCTLVYLSREVSETGEAMTFQTVDWTPILAPYYHVLKIKVNGYPRIIMFTLAGIIGLVGGNENGVNVFMNILLTNENIALGVPAYPLLRIALESKDLSQAIDRLRNIKRCSPFNYLLSDGNGRAVNIEASANHFLLSEIKDRYYVHTNHCLSPPLTLCDIYSKVTQTDETYVRYSRASTLIDEILKVRKLNIQDVFRILSDHYNFPNSICRHPIESIPEERKMRTVGAVISEESKDHVWILWGNPCKNNYYKISY
ncbi:MAG: C45 family peptidase [Thermoproteota archaeon]